MVLRAWPACLSQEPRHRAASVGRRGRAWAQFARLRSCPRPGPAPKRACRRAEAGRSPAFRMPTCRCMQRLSSESHCLSRDPNLADRSYFDPLTRENNGPRLKIRTNNGAYGTARAWTRKTRTQNGGKRGDRPFSSAAAQKVRRVGVCRRFPWRRFSGGL